MTDFLLGTRALKEMIAAKPVIIDWLNTQTVGLHTTLASIASLLASAESLADVSLRRSWIDRLTENVPADFGPRLHGFDLDAARQWSAVRTAVPVAQSMTQHDLLIVAVALSEDLIYVAPREDWHNLVTGLRQYDPWTSKTYPA